MLLSLDIGNTHILIGVYQRAELVFHARLRTEPKKTADEYGVTFLQFLATHDIKKEAIHHIIICSVVPPLLSVLTETALHYLDLHPMIVDSGTETGIQIVTDNPAEVGSDRIVNAAAAWKEYGGPCLVVDFGTATTFDVVTGRGEYIGGAIVPGINIALDALIEKTSMLPQIEIKKPERAIGSGTIQALQSGIYYANLGMLEKIIQTISLEMGEKPFVVATGGMAMLAGDGVQGVDTVNPYLTLNGLQYIFEKNRKTPC